ncbi:MAG TPA: hypothetical protein VK524_23345 [Polyangiaceae bacterium]|nr:hypothetical protein [Polyangiaceae bacterium]
MYAPAGRDTLSALAKELARAEAVASGGEEPPEALPTLELGALIEPRPIDAVEVDADAETRRFVTTKDYAAPKSTPAERRAARLAAASAPEITVSHAPAGRETLAAINDELCDEPSTGVRSTLNVGRAAEAVAETEFSALDIFEMLTFVVQGSSVEELSSQDSRRRFVMSRLRHRLPIRTESEIDRIDVTPWNIRGTVVVRVWCKVRESER